MRVVIRVELDDKAADLIALTEVIGFWTRLMCSEPKREK